MGGCVSGYGPAVDQSRFITAKLLEDNRTSVFSYHYFVYRPAAGLRAFPDGGIPKYLKDVHIIGTVDNSSGVQRILFCQSNSKWAHGSGKPYIVESQGRKILVQRGGQNRDLSLSNGEVIVIDVDTGKKEIMYPREEIAKLGREYLEMRLADGNGVIVFIAVLAGAGDKPEVPRELWARKPGGNWVKVADTQHYETCRNGEIFYWMPNSRTHFAFNVASGSSRTAPEFRVPEMQIITNGVNVSGDGLSLEYGTIQNDTWVYAPMTLDIDAIRHAKSL